MCNRGVANRRLALAYLPADGSPWGYRNCPPPTATPPGDSRDIYVGIFLRITVTWRTRKVEQGRVRVRHCLGISPER